MAFESGLKGDTCGVCQQLFPYYKNIQSWRGEHAYDEPRTLQEQEGDRPPIESKYKRLCTSREWKPEGTTGA
eukprot:87559-Prorocentrum_lima.AAC.1